MLEIRGKFFEGAERPMAHRPLDLTEVFQQVARALDALLNGGLVNPHAQPPKPPAEPPAEHRVLPTSEDTLRATKPKMKPPTHDAGES